MSYPKLLEPGKIGNVEIRNRVVMTAMGVDVSNYDGTPSDRTLAYYAERAKGGTGLLITEYCRVNESDGACATNQLSLSDDDRIEPMKKLVDSVHAEGAKFFIQLHHPGRQAMPIFRNLWPLSEQIGKRFPGYWDAFFSVTSKFDMNSLMSTDHPYLMRTLMLPVRGPLAPSTIPMKEDGALICMKPDPFTTKQVKRLIQQFIDAAERAKKAGADGVELHAAHGYLLQQFLSPHTNRRKDEYGGSFENRCRIMKELIEGIHARCGADYPVIVRLNVNEHYEILGHPERGIRLPYGVKLAREMERYGADGIDVSIASYDATFLITESMRYPLSWRDGDIRAVKQAVNIPIIAVDVIRTPEQAEQLLESGSQDFIGLGRALLADPMWVKKAAMDRADQINRCISCCACMDSFMEDMLKNDPIPCAINPRTCREVEYAECGEKNGAGRLVVVVGSGPAGLIAARELAKREFRVILMEKDDEPGGQINLADKPLNKERIHWVIDDLMAQCKELGVEFRFGTEATPENIQEAQPYAVFLATGSTASKPPIPGTENDYVVTTTPVLDGSVSWTGKNIILVGSGMTGLETAELLVSQGNRVTVLEMLDKILSGKIVINLKEIELMLQENNIAVLTGRKLQKIEDHVVTAERKDGTVEEFYADAVVLSLGVKKNDELAKALEGTGVRTILVGDVAAAGRIKDAVQSAYIAARELN